jgi:uncharacterized protein YwgA
MNNIGLNVPWKRYALIVKLAQAFQKINRQFGKTALQKMVYLFQEIYRVDCDYSFDFYTYGPFTSQLLNDLDYTEHIGGVNVSRVDNSVGGYEITPGEDVEYILKKAEGFIEAPDINAKLEQLIADFGRYSAVELELRSTIVYVDRDLRRTGTWREMEEILRLVKELKPKFSPDEIRSAIEELKSRQFIL